jgi:hypothetical protein
MERTARCGSAWPWLILILKTINSSAWEMFVMDGLKRDSALTNC